MNESTLIWGSPGSIAGALALLGVSIVVLLWSYGRARARRGVVVACATLKGLAFTGLVLGLLEPLLSGTRPRPGANVFAILADNSMSLVVRDPGDDRSRGDLLRDRLLAESEWRTQLGQEFDVRRYAFDASLRAVDGFDDLTFDGTGSSIGPTLEAIATRFRGLPLAGVLLFTDGNRTDVGPIDGSGLPPVYPVLPRDAGPGRDVGVSNVSVSQSNFEAAPVVLRADVEASGLEGESIVAVVLDENGAEVERQETTAGGDATSLPFRFQFRPEQLGVNFYTVRASASIDEASIDADDGSSIEQTLANNSRTFVVDQGGGPHRVLYVSGRPNWEFKFLRRAVRMDEQVELVGLLRIARRQPKFDFQASGTRTTSQLFNGFELDDEDDAERFDEPVLVRLDTIDEAELRDGFPKAADELCRYDALIVDDLEAEFFSADQLALVRDFVSVRGGGLLMLGGPDSFSDGGYDRTPIGELLPVYLDRAAASSPDPINYRLVLTREGWLQPWVRTRATEDEERARLSAMPPFRTLSRAGDLKPGAVVLASVRDQSDDAVPALVTQPFGRGQVAALLVGDLWRWGLRRGDPVQDDFDRAWRQTVRWLVGDVPGRVEINVRAAEGSASPAVELIVRVRDPEYLPLDNADVTLRTTLPDGTALDLEGEPDDREAGAYTATIVTRQPGPYRFEATAKAPDGGAIGQREAGWAAQPTAFEFDRLAPDRAFAETIASETGGEVVEADNLDAFVARLSTRAAPISEPWTAPIWHHPIFFLVAIACLVAEWGLRRVNGLA